MLGAKVFCLKEQDLAPDQSSVVKLALIFEEILSFLW